MGVVFAAFLVIATLAMSMFSTHNDDDSGGVFVVDDSRLGASAEMVAVLATTTSSSSSSSSAASNAERQSEKDTISIEDFSNPTMEWRTMNDPVMGGRSKSSVVIEDGTAHFEGICAIVPFLKAPGFITMTTGVHSPPGFGFLRKIFTNAEDEPSLFPDVSSCSGLSVTLRSTVPYQGYYVSFGTDKAPGGRHASGYKSSINLPDNDAFVDLELPFSGFSSNWDDATGHTKVTCLEDPGVCPSDATLADMQTISFWGEGVEGTIALEIQTIGAYGCAAPAAAAASRNSSNSNSRTFELASASLLSGETMDGTMGMVIAPCAVLALGAVVMLVGAKRRNPSPSRDDYEEVGGVEEAALLV